MKKNKLLIIQPQPFGSLTDSLKWCEYLKDKYEITVICQNTKKEKPITNGFHVKYLKSFGNRQMRGLLFAIQCILNIALFKGSILIVYFEHCNIFKLIFPWKKMIVDIRTLSTSLNPKLRQEADIQLTKGIQTFDKISIISLKLLNRLNIPANCKTPIYELPLGADIIEFQNKDYSELKLLYVGGLFGRDIDKTIIGISTFLKKHPNISLRYTIIGIERHNEIQDLKQLTHKLGIESYINFIPRLPHPQLTEYFQNYNIGVSFIPVTEYFNLQPPTKTFEYILAGMICLATNTEANKDIITPQNGILHNDTAEDFANALEHVSAHISDYEPHAIQNSLTNYSWKNIVNNILVSIIEA